jgi:hypothetical protein
MSSLLFYNVENVETNAMSNCVQTFDWYCIYLKINVYPTVRERYENLDTAHPLLP